MARLTLNGEIVSNDDASIYRSFGFNNVCCPGDLKAALDSMEDGDSLELAVNSLGGSVYAGMEMYSMIRDSGRQVTAKVYGTAASAMSVVICACDPVEISPVGSIMIHRSSASVSGNSRDMKEAKQMLDSIDENILNAYEIKCKGKSSREQLAKWMRNETHFDAKTAIEIGLADEMLFSEDDLEAAAREGSFLPPVDELKVQSPSHIFSDLSTTLAQDLTTALDDMKTCIDETDPVNPDAFTIAEYAPVGNIETDAEEREEKMEITNIAELREAYGDLLAQAEAEAAAKERERITEIHALSMSGFEDLIDEAVSDPSQNAGTVAMKIIARQKEQGKTYMQNVAKDAEPANEVAGTAMPAEAEDPKAKASADAKDTVRMWEQYNGSLRSGGVE